MNIKDKLLHWSSSKTGGIVLATIGIALLCLLMFQAGVAFGERRAFHQMRAMTGRGPMAEFGFLSHSFIPGAGGHGVVGTITSVTLPTFTITTREGEIETVVVASSTVVRGQPGQTANDLRTGEGVVILGEPENGSEKFTARFINIVPGFPSGK